MTPNQADLLTIHELNLMIDGYSDRSREAFKESIIVAYYNAYFQRAKKMPNLEKILKNIDSSSKSGKSKRREMSDIELFEVAKTIARRQTS